MKCCLELSRVRGDDDSSPRNGTFVADGETIKLNDQAEIEDTMIGTSIPLRVLPGVSLTREPFRPPHLLLCARRADSLLVLVLTP